MGDRHSLLHRSLARAAGFLYRSCDRVVVVSPASKDYLIEHWHTPREKISIVENGVDADLFSPKNTNGDLRRELGADGKFVVCYIGTMGMAHGLETLVEAATRLQHSAPQVLFLLVGEGAEKERIISLAHSRGLTNIRFVDQQPREKIPAYICSSDACLVLLKKADLFKTVIPTKMLEFMSCARAVILGVDGQARRIVEEAQAGIYVEPENAADLVPAVIRLAGDAALRESLGRNGRLHVLKHFSRQRTAHSYIAVLEEMLRIDRHKSVAA
jgi:glycosyltransferase involved in cell wall biosynthesis